MTSFDDAFRFDVEAATGGWQQALETVKRKTSQLTSGSDGMWIGIASNGQAGARARWNAKYKGLGMKHMAIVYETSSDSFRKKMEDDLVDFYEEHVDNERAGGGGGNGTAPYVVYVAWN